MQTIMILSGGTSTAWHIAEVLRRNFDRQIHLIICDINPRALVHTSVLADEYIQVPPIRSEGYYEQMVQLMRERQVNILIPLIDDDIFLFPRDNADLIALRVQSVAPRKAVIEALSNKENLEQSLRTLGVETPHIFKNVEDIKTSDTYFVKDAVGCGSRGSHLVDGNTARDLLLQGRSQVVQEVCRVPEITVDVAHDGTSVHTVCRQRIEIKLGVSTKCRVYYDPEVQAIMERIITQIELPSVFCVQFMRNHRDALSLIDFNLRSGGGTAISAAAGFEAIRFAAANWLGLSADPTWVPVLEQERYVVRTYREIVTK